MKTQRNICIAFLLNLAFSVFELFGGIFTGSIAILSDALHDLGDAASIGISYFLERKSKKQPDEIYTYGYSRFSVLGGLITTVILLVGSVIMIVHAAQRLAAPAEIHYNGMILFAIVGVCVNVLAAFFTREGESINQRAVNLHMLEDVFGWVAVLVGAVVMHFTDFKRIDPLLSIGISLFVIFHALRNLKTVADLFLQKVPNGVSAVQIKAHLEQLPGVLDVHHIHLWSMDGQHPCATMHVVTEGDPHTVKHAIREELQHQGIAHVTLELETKDEPCHHKTCYVTPIVHHHHHH